MVELHLAKVDVAGSNPVSRSIFFASGPSSAVPTARFCVVEAPWPSGKATVCKTVIPRFESGWRLQFFPHDNRQDDLI